MRLSERDRRALMMGGVVTLAGLLAFRAIPWGARQVTGLQQDLESRRMLLAQARAELAAPGVLEDSALALRKGIEALAPRILAGSSEAEALASLSGQLTHLATAHQSKVLQFEGQPDSTTAGGLRRVTAKAAIEGDIRGITALLAELSTESIVVVPTALAINVVDPAPTGRSPEVLRLEITVTGWHLMTREGA
jgi:hypothetical protein